MQRRRRKAVNKRIRIFSFYPPCHVFLAIPIYSCQQQRFAHKQSLSFATSDLTTYRIGVAGNAFLELSLFRGDNRVT